MKIQYSIDVDKRLITEIWPEKVSIEDYQQVKQSEFNDPNFDPKFDVITDLRLLKIKYNEAILDKIISFIKINFDKISNRKSAIVTNSPNQVANSMMFSIKGKILPLNIEIFSTMESAVKWILEK